MQFSLKQKLIASASILILALGATYATFFAAVSHARQNVYLYIDHDDTPDSVYTKICTSCQSSGQWRLHFSGTLLAYSKHVHPGRYLITPSMGAMHLMRNLRGGRQEPVKLVIPVVHTTENLAARLATMLEADSSSIAQSMHDEALLHQLDVDSTSLACLFIPDTYEVYWDIAPKALLIRMKKERDNFWTEERKFQAKQAGLTPNEAYTLASIIEQESANEAERPMIAGMYLNRLHSGMKLQADPTVKYALKDFALRRIMHKHLSVDSPYNTYLHEGLPIGPICIPSRSSIQAVLHYKHHNYLYMCAKEDFSGTHNFATTYEEHLQNAKRYAEALNHRGIQE